MADTPEHRRLEHPTPLTYFKVATILAALTGIEVGVFYVDALEPVFLPIFLILSVVKFILVVLFYMHLKFDSRLFSGVFVGGLLLAIAVAVVLMSLFQVLSAVANPPEGEEVIAVVGEPTPTPTPSPVGPTPTPTMGPAPTHTPTPPVGSTPTPTRAQPQGDLVALGREIFLNAPASVGPQPLWCSLCHKIEGVSNGLIGPDLTHIATDGATRKPGLSAKDYIRESISDPEGFICDAERCPPGLMTTAVVGGLADDEVDALVAFLMEQK